jgi:hypothetical protein
MPMLIKVGLVFSRKIVKLDGSLALLEAKLQSTDENNALRHSASQKAQQSSSDGKIFSSTNLVGESSRLVCLLIAIFL